MASGRTVSGPFGSGSFRGAEKSAFERKLIWREIRPGWTGPRSSVGFPGGAAKFSRSPRVVGVTCKESRGVSGNALLWPGGVFACGVRRSRCGVRNSIGFRKTHSGTNRGCTRSTVAFAIGRFAHAGAGERRECLVLVPLVRRLAAVYRAIRWSFQSNIFFRSATNSRQEDFFGVDPKKVHDWSRSPAFGLRT